MKNKQKVKERNRGITIIALVVTIIVLLILASITIMTLTGENGIIGKAQEAKIETEKSDIKEQIEIMTIQSTNQIGNLDKDKLKENLETLPEGKEIIDAEDFIYVVYPQYSFEIDTNTGEAKEVDLKKTTDTTPWELAGEGTQENPYLIESIEDLVAFSNNVNKGQSYSGKYVKLAQTLDFKSLFSYQNFKTKVSEKSNRIIEQDSEGTEIMTFLTTGKGFNPIGSFGGHFDGNGKEISNIYINRPEEEYVALFKSNSGVIEKIGITGSITGKTDGNFNYVAGIVATLSESSIVQYCYNKAQVMGNNTIGGICSGNGGIVQYCYNMGTIKGKSQMGGISNGSNVKKSYNAGTIIATEYSVGGINSFGDVEDCYNLGSVTSLNSYWIGGVVGTCQANIKNCYNKGKITGRSDVGAIIGNYYSSQATIENCYYLEGTAPGAARGEDIEGQAEALPESQMPKVIDVIQAQVEVDGKTIEVWKEDVNHINQGYPLLFWQEQ